MKRIFGPVLVLCILVLVVVLSVLQQAVLSKAAAPSMTERATPANRSPILRLFRLSSS